MQDGGVSLIIYNGWPVHGPNNTQIFTRAEINRTTEDVQEYLRNGKKPATLNRINTNTASLVRKVTTLEDSASPDGNALRVESGGVLNVR